MLKFLDNRTHQKPQRSPKAYKPQFIYGNSYQSPKQFQTAHTIFHNSSYVNPYLNYEIQRASKLPSKSFHLIHPRWKNKVDLQSVQQHKILSPQKNPQKQLPPGLRHSRYLTTFHEQLNKKKQRFRKSRGQFTQFIEKNIKFKPLGPLHGDQRDETRIQEAKRTVWLKPSKSMCESTKHSYLQSTDLNFSVKSSISKNSALLTEKQRIRQTREKTYVNYRKSLERRKYQKPNSHLFELPRDGQEHQLTMMTRPVMHRFSMVERKVSDSESETLYKDMNSFEVTMYQKFK